MSTWAAAARLLGRVALVGAAGGAAAVGTLWNSARPSQPPSDMPELALEAPSRSSQMAALKGSNAASPFDILVIGGGATGSGVALDAATRGLRVALLERYDFSSGTSSRSTKLVHGGVRYLEKAVIKRDPAQLKLVAEALRERAVLLHVAPHLSWPLPTLMPCYDWLQLPYIWAGLKLYDLIAGPNVLYPSRFVTKAEAQALVPTLADKAGDGRRLIGGLVYTDGQMDDSRLNLGIALTAACAGAVVANHAEVTGLLKDEATGLVTGAQVVDRLTGEVVQVHAKTTVNATGVYADRVRKMASPEAESIMLASSGAHVVLPAYYLGGADALTGTGIIIPKTKDGRVLFALPWEGRVVVGTTDEKCDITDAPRWSPKEVSYILETISSYLNIEVHESDVLSTWSGLRPLVQMKKLQHGAKEGEKEADTQNIVREHKVIVDPDSGLVTVTGGKWTTYRSMAEDAVDLSLAAGKRFGHQLMPKRAKSVTEHVPIVGALGFHRGLASQLAQSSVVVARGTDGKLRPSRLDLGAANHLARSYGFQALKVVDIAKAESLGTRLAPTFPYLEAEVVYSARHEMCATATDFLLHRSRLAFLDAKAAMEALPRVVELLGKEHKWSGRQSKAELQAAKESISQFFP